MKLKTVDMGEQGQMNGSRRASAVRTPAMLQVLRCSRSVAPQRSAAWTIMASTDRQAMLDPGVRGGLDELEIAVDHGPRRCRPGPVRTLRRRGSFLLAREHAEQPDQHLRADHAGAGGTGFRDQLAGAALLDGVARRRRSRPATLVSKKAGTSAIPVARGRGSRLRRARRAACVGLRARRRAGAAPAMRRCRSRP